MCIKVKYKDKLFAMFALSQTRRVGRFNPVRNKCRVYFCPECKCWHLTSKI